MHKKKQGIALRMSLAMFRDIILYKMKRDYQENDIRFGLRTDAQLHSQRRP